MTDRLLLSALSLTVVGWKRARRSLLLGLDGLDGLDDSTGALDRENVSVRWRRSQSTRKNIKPNSIRLRSRQAIVKRERE